MKKMYIVCLVLFSALLSVSSAEATLYTRNLTLGSRGDDVSSLQTFLIAKGFDVHQLVLEKFQKDISELKHVPQ